MLDQRLILVRRRCGFHHRQYQQPVSYSNDPYHGDIASAMVLAVQEAGGLLSAEDLADYTTSSESPLHIEHRGYAFYQTPPNSQGVVTLVALQVLERLRERAGPELNGDPTGRRIHLQVAAYLEGLRLRDRLVADPAFMPVSAETLIDAEACRQLADRVDLTRPRRERSPPFGRETPRR